MDDVDWWLGSLKISYPLLDRELFMVEPVTHAAIIYDSHRRKG
jgi:hypothetical protein